MSKPMKIVLPALQGEEKEQAERNTFTVKMSPCKYHLGLNFQPEDTFSRWLLKMIKRRAFRTQDLKALKHFGFTIKLVQKELVLTDELKDIVEIWIN